MILKIGSVGFYNSFFGIILKINVVNFRSVKIINIYLIKM